MKKIISIAFLFILGAALWTALIQQLRENVRRSAFTEQEALQISSECSQVEDRPSCLKSKITAYVTNSPEKTKSVFQTFWDLEKAGVLNDDSRIFSEITHEVGMHFITMGLSFETAMSYCDPAFKQGCVHGVVMEHIDHYYPAPILPYEHFGACGTAAKGDYNMYINCIHGVGHALVAKNSEKLTALLAECQIYTSDLEHEACVSGILMEYSTGEVGHGHHSHQRVGTQELPCSELEETYQKVCFASAASYRQYYSNQEPVSTSYEYCTSVPEEYREACTEAVAERIYYAVNASRSKFEKLCREIEVPETQNSCLESITRIGKKLPLEK